VGRDGGLDAQDEGESAQQSHGVSVRVGRTSLLIDIVNYIS